MVGKEDANASSSTLCNRRMFWRSASWSSSRTTLQISEGEEKDSADSNGSNGGSINSQNCRYPVPLTPRFQSNSKGRSCLPPLQPLAIARRSLDEWPKAGSDDIGEWPNPLTPGRRGDISRNEERLKLDLSNIQSKPDKNGGGLVKRDKIAFFDKKCSKVAEHIYLGGDTVARDRAILKKNGITHVLNCVGFVCPEYFKSDFVYRTLWLQDNPTEDITSILYDVFDYFEDVREQRGRVLVHCCQGVSRSTSLVIAYLMWREGQSFDDAFQYVKAARGIADPNMGFACQLLQCQKRVHAFPLSPSSLLRMYRISPHSLHDPLHLVPKMLNDPSPSALDSRGAFILHSPCTIYIWVGKKCESIMERDARGAVDQVVRYERVQGPIVMVKEGEEPTYFWDTFSSLLPLMDKSTDGLEARESAVKVSPGERKVGAYDVDFEIFQKAIVGCFLPPFPSSETNHETCPLARESSWSALRCKFASGNMKEFVSAIKTSISKIYPDSVSSLNVDKYVTPHSSVNSSSSSFSHSSSSSSLPLSSSPPPYFSSDSVSSNCGCRSKSSSESPALPEFPSSVSLSSTPAFSKLSLLSSRISPEVVADNPEDIVVSSSFQPLSLSDSSPCKLSPLSLAERRGSLSRNLQLPATSENVSLIISPPTPLNQEVGAKSNGNTVYDMQNTYNNSGTHDGSEKQELHVGQQHELQTSCNSFLNIEPMQKKAGFYDICGGSRDFHSGKNKETAVLNVMEGSNLAHPSPTQLLVCRWPSLEKVERFVRGDLNSEVGFLFLTPGTDSGRDDSKILYIWLGRSFSHGKSKIQLDSRKLPRGSGVIDYTQVGADLLTRMCLPDDTTIKIVKEDEEPVEFHALLSSL